MKIKAIASTAKQITEVQQKQKSTAADLQKHSISVLSVCYRCLPNKNMK